MRTGVNGSLTGIAPNGAMRALAVLLLLACPAGAGPWPRAAGEIYVYSGHEGGRDGWSSLYAELGGPLNLTFGLDLGGHVAGVAMADPDAVFDGRLRAFVRVPLRAADHGGAGWLAPWLLSVEAGLGQDMDGDFERATRRSIGVTAGRGLGTRWGDGWTTFGLRRTGGGGLGTRMEAEAVIGLKPTDRLTFEVGVFAERTDATYVAVVPTVQYGIGRLGDARVGIVLRDEGEAVLKLGIARTF